MADVVTPAVRSRMMAGIRSTNTGPEMAIRKALHRRGFRYRLHAAGVPGRPDMVFPRYRAAVFVHGCFWHGHDCRFFRLPGTRTEFWRAKIARNRKRDADVAAMLAKAGWRQLTVWECTVRGKGTDAAEKAAGRIARWLRSRTRRREMRGD